MKSSGMKYCELYDFFFKVNEQKSKSMTDSRCLGLRGEGLEIRKGLQRGTSNLFEE